MDANINLTFHKGFI